MDSLGEILYFKSVIENRLLFYFFLDSELLKVFFVVLGPLEKGQVRNEALRELRVELSKKHAAGELDGFTLYL